MCVWGWGGGGGMWGSLEGELGGEAGCAWGGGGGVCVCVCVGGGGGGGRLLSRWPILPPPPLFFSSPFSFFFSFFSFFILRAEHTSCGWMIVLYATRTEVTSSFHKYGE